MAEYISKMVVGDNVIDLTGDSAKENHVLSGYTFHKSNGEPTTGSCTFDSNTTDATAESAEVLNGETFYARGQKQTGNMPNRGKQTGSISTVNGSVTIQQGYHDGSGNVTIDATERAKLIAANIKAGVTVLGVEGRYSGAGVNAQAKSATPSFSQQTVLPDAGYDYLSQVTIEPISVTKVLNSSGGYTVTVNG